MEGRTEVIGDDHKKLGFAFAQFLGRLKVQNTERCETIAKLIGEEFGVDPSGAGGMYDANVDLLEVFRAALKEKGGEDEEKQKFEAFLSLLEKKGYFKGTEPGTEEYESRVEKARGKFKKHSNPYEGLTAEEIKAKGNELMTQCKYKEAIAAYTKAIELNPENHIYFGNRSAAYTHVKDYTNAILDSERSIALNPNYAKSYSRLGTALFYEGSYDRAVEAFTKACDLDPDNQTYKDDVKRATEKKNASSLANNGAGGMPGMPGMGGFPGMPGMGGGMPDMNQMAALMNNPQFMEMAQNMMQNPEVSQMMAKMASGQLTPEELLAEASQPTEDGKVRTPFGAVPKETLEELQREGMNDPKFAAIRADIQANGIGAMQKYMSDPDVLAMMGKMSSLFTPK